jgi:hypothetical protein
MSSILLGPLVNSKNENTLNSIYNSNISNKINMVEKQQASQNYNQPEFLRQFDDLKFDNIGDPVGINDSYNTIKGLNNSLQRNIDFQRGYSSFQDSDMHYDVVTKDKFTHNNMVPQTSRRDLSSNITSNRSQRKLETFTGIDSNYVSKKEKVPLFEPSPNLTWVNGMPVIADKLVTRYLPSNKNNYGNLPFQNNVKVKPGIDFENQEGNYAVYRVNPRNIDLLRSDINQKISYKNKPLETIKKGENRAPDPNLSKFKLPDFRETTFDQLIPSRADIEKPKQTGVYTNVTSQRNETDIYYQGHAVNTNIGNGPNNAKTKFEPAKRETYKNDLSHAVFAVNQKPVMINTNSYINYENQRATTSTEYKGQVSNPLVGGGSMYTIDYTDVPLTTTRELMLNGNTNIGIVGSQQQSNYIFSNDMVLPITNRQNTSHNMVINTRGEEKSVPVYNKDLAKITLRPSTSHNMVTNTRGEEKSVPVYNEDLAKMTIRSSTSHNMVTNTRGEEKSVPVYNEDLAKMTIRSSTSHNIVTNTRGEARSVPIYNEDLAKMTIRSSTSHNIVTNTRGEAKSVPVYNENLAKTTLRPSTSHNIVINTRGEEKSVPIYNKDLAKMTLRPSTSHNIVINTRGEEKSVPIYNKDLAKMTLRPSTSHNIVINTRGEEKSVPIYNKDLAKMTLRPATSHNIVINTRGEEKSVPIYNKDLAKMTLRSSTSHNMAINVAPKENSGYVELTDIAKNTIKQDTLFMTPEINIKSLVTDIYTSLQDHAKPTIKQSTLISNRPTGNPSQLTSNYIIDKQYNAKSTLRQTTEHNQYVGHVNPKTVETGYVINKENKARPTIKETTLSSTPMGRLNNLNMGNYVKDNEDIARTTLKQTTMLHDYTGGLHGGVDGQISHDAINNMEIDERREQLTYNRNPNGKGDVYGPYIDKDNVRMNDRRELYSYVSHPCKPLDMSVMPTISKDTIQNIYSISKPVIETSSYYINPYFINTLNNNPLVNDIYHQKNV